MVIEVYVCVWSTNCPVKGESRLLIVEDLIICSLLLLQQLIVFMVIAVKNVMMIANHCEQHVTMTTTISNCSAPIISTTLSSRIDMFTV
ncbi:hypothetical protein FKM82_001189 [Ascaphus truei]